MATYTASNFYTPAPTAPMVGVVLSREFLFTVSPALALNDIIKLAPIPAGCVIDDWFIDVPDCDTGGSPAITMSVGDSGSATRFSAALTTGQAGGRINNQTSGTAATCPFEYTAADDFRLTIAAGPQTGATSVVFRGRILYHMVGMASPV